MTSTKYFLVVAFLIAIYIFSDSQDNVPGRGQTPSSATEAGTADAGTKPADGPVIWPPSPTYQVSLADNPLADNYLIMLDISGSMTDLVCHGKETKINAAKRAVKIFQQQLDPVDNVGLYTFSDSIDEILPIGRYTAQIFGQNVDDLQAGGGTPLRKALIKSERLLREAAQSQGGYGSYNLILITDGQSSDGEPKNQAETIAKTTAIAINAVGFCTGQQHSLNIAGYTNFSTADNADQLVESLSRSVKAEQDVFDLSDFNPS